MGACVGKAGARSGLTMGAAADGCFSQKKGPAQRRHVHHVPPHLLGAQPRALDEHKDRARLLHADGRHADAVTGKVVSRRCDDRAACFRCVSRHEGAAGCLGSLLAARLCLPAPAACRGEKVNVGVRTAVGDGLDAAG